MSRERVALVTGSAGGIGAAVAEELAKTARRIIGLDIPGSDHSKVQERCESHGAEFVPLSIDVTDESSVQTAFKSAKVAERLDIVVCMAGIAQPAGPAGPVHPTETEPLDEWRRVLDINLTGTFLVCRSAIPLLKRNGWGRIITTGSQTAKLVSGNAGGAYAASKAGVIAFTRVMAVELGPVGITSNCINPGLTDTRLAASFNHEEYAKTVPLGRLGQPVDIANAVAFLASDAAKFITGVTLDVNGGKYMA